MIHIDKKNHAKKKRARWRARQLGGILIKKGRFFEDLPTPQTPTEKRCMKEIIRLLIRK